MSLIIILTIAFGFYIPQYAFAIKVTEILSEPVPVAEPVPMMQPAPAMQFLNTMIFLRNYLEQKGVPDYPREIDRLWDNNEHEVTKALSLVFYKILCSEKQVSTDTTFSAPKLKCPQIRLVDFVIRFLKYAPFRTSPLVVGPVSSGTVITALMCLDEIRSKNIDTLFIDRFNVHRLFAVSFVASYKFYEDNYYDNKFLARVTGVPESELNHMELEFVKKIGWRFLYSAELVDEYRVLFESILRKAPYIEWDYDR